MKASCPFMSYVCLRDVTFALNYSSCTKSCANSLDLLLVQICCSCAEKIECVYRLDMFGLCSITWLSFVGQLCGFIKYFWQSQPWWSHVLLLVIIINAKWKPLAALLLLLKLNFKSLTTLRPLLWIWEFLNSTFSFLSFCRVVFIFHWALLILWLCCSSVFTLLHIAWNSRQT